MGTTLHKDLTGADLHIPKAHTHVKAEITDFPVLIPGTGNGDVVGPVSATPGNVAAFADDTGKVVQDGGAIPTTLPASDVSAWAKSGTKPAYASSEIANISAAGQALIDDANAAAQLATLGTAAYSEGAWTPTLNAATIVGSAPVVTGIVRQIGKLIFIQAVILAGSGGNTSVASSGAYIGGVPTASSGAIEFALLNQNGSLLGTAAFVGSIYLPTFAAQTVSICISGTYSA